MLTCDSIAHLPELPPRQAEYTDRAVGGENVVFCDMADTEYVGRAITVRRDRCPPALLPSFDCLVDFMTCDGFCSLRIDSEHLARWHRATNSEYQQLLRAATALLEYRWPTYSYNEYPGPDGLSPPYSITLSQDALRAARTLSQRALQEAMERLWSGVVLQEDTNA